MISEHMDMGNNLIVDLIIESNEVIDLYKLLSAMA